MGSFVDNYSRKSRAVDTDEHEDVVNHFSFIVLIIQYKIILPYPRTRPMMNPVVAERLKGVMDGFLPSLLMLVRQLSRLHYTT